MSDLFHEDVPDEFIDQVFAVMRQAHWHTFQVLTKRAERLHRYLAMAGPNGRTAETRIRELAPPAPPRHWYHATDWHWPLPNVWIGTSVENQQYADERIPLLLQVPAAVRFLSCEPLLGPVDLGSLAWVSLSRSVRGDWPFGHLTIAAPGIHQARLNPHGAVSVQADDGQLLGIKPSEMEWCRKIDMVIVGGESGPGARPMHPDWVRSLRDQSTSAGVPFFFKQWGEWVPFATEARYAAGSLMPGNDETVGGDCGGPLSLSQFQATKDGRNTCVAWWRLDDGKEFKKRVETVTVANHRWGKENLLDTTYLRVGKKAAGALLDGREWREFPQAN